MMRAKRIQAKWQISNLLASTVSPRNQRRFIGNLARRIKNSPIGYAGFLNRTLLQKYLRGRIYTNSQKDLVTPFTMDEREVESLIAEVLQRCHEKIRTPRTHVFVFPTFDPIIKRDLGGVGGFTPWKNVIHIFVNPRAGWERELQQTVAHEFAHAVGMNVLPWQSLLDSVIFEGVAEHFREHTLGGRRARWATALKAKAVMGYFRELIPLLNSLDEKTYRDVFFGSRKFPRWAGYTIGYFIVGSFLRRNQLRDWNVIIRKKPEYILKQSRFLDKKIATLPR